MDGQPGSVRLRGPIAIFNKNVFVFYVVYEEGFLLSPGALDSLVLFMRKVFFLHLVPWIALCCI